MKSCKNCKKLFLPRFSSLEKVCSITCAIELQKENPKEKKKYFISPVSEKRAKQLKDYRENRREFLKGKICPVTGKTATEIHHTEGRTGKRLNDLKKCIAVSREGHLYIHANPAESRSKGWLI